MARSTDIPSLWRGTYAQYKTITTKDSKILYFVDEGAVFRGDTLIAGFDRNVAFSSLYTGSNALYAYKLFGIDVNGRVQPLTTASGTGTSKAVNTVAIRPSELYAYKSDTTVAANSAIDCKRIISAGLVDNPAYTFNATLTAAREVWLKGTIDSQGMLTLDNSSVTAWAVQVPTGTSITLSTYFKQGYCYVLVGRVGAQDILQLYEKHDVYYCTSDGVLVTISAHASDSDKLNGQSASYYAAASSVTAANLRTTIGAGTKANITGSDTTAHVWTGSVLKSALDDYVTLATTQTITGYKAFKTTGYGSQVSIYRDSSSGDSVIKYENSTGLLGYIGMRQSDKQPYTRTSDTNYMIWHEGNDGASSGLDADLLDGKHASSFLLTTDISDWAKASTKPSYAFSEITNKPSAYTPTIGSTATTAAAGNHVYHYLTSNAEYWDSYSQDRLFRIVYENMAKDILRFRGSTVSNVQYWDYTNSTWTSWNKDLSQLFGGSGTGSVQIPYAQRKFRFQITANSGWPTTAMFLLQGGWFDSGAYTTFANNKYINVNIETRASTSAEFASKLSFSFANSTQGTNARVTGALHTGETLYRITIEICPWANTSNPAGLSKIGILSNYGGAAVAQANYDSVGNFFPLSNDKFSLGNTTYKWKNVYATSFTENGTALSSKYLQLGGGTITGDTTLDGCKLKLKSGTNIAEISFTTNPYLSDSSKAVVIDYDTYLYDKLYVENSIYAQTSVNTAYLYAGTIYENNTSISSKYTAKNTLTTKGDIYYASAAKTPARLGIGTSGQVLAVGSSGVPAWTTLSYATQSWVNLQGFYKSGDTPTFGSWLQLESSSGGSVYLDANEDMSSLTGIYGDTNVTGLQIENIVYIQEHLVVEDEVYAGDYRSFSDRRLKNHIADFRLSLEDMATLPLAKYAYKKKPDVERVGTYAQEVQAILPQAVSENKDGILALDYNCLNTAVTLSLVQEVVELKARIAQLENIINPN